MKSSGAPTRRFGRVLAAVLQNPEISQSAKAVYALLSTYADQDGVCFPGVDVLARDLDVTPRSVIRHITELEELHVVQRIDAKRTRKYRLITLSEVTFIGKNGAAEFIENDVDEPANSDTDVTNAGVNEEVLCDTGVTKNGSCDTGVAKDPISDTSVSKDPAEPVSCDTDVAKTTPSTDGLCDTSVHGLVTPVSFPPYITREGNQEELGVAVVVVGAREADPRPANVLPMEYSFNPIDRFPTWNEIRDYCAQFQPEDEALIREVYFSLSAADWKRKSGSTYRHAGAAVMNAYNYRRKHPQKGVDAAPTGHDETDPYDPSIHPPTIEEFLDYAEVNDVPLEDAKDIYYSYSSSGWKKKGGDPVEHWGHALINAYRVRVRERDKQSSNGRSTSANQASDRDKGSTYGTTTATGGRTGDGSYDRVGQKIAQRVAARTARQRTDQDPPGGGSGGVESALPGSAIG